MILSEGTAISWTYQGTTCFGYIAMYLPKGQEVPMCYRNGRRGTKLPRFRSHQFVSKHDDRYIVDCGIHTIDYNGDTPVKDVVYRMVNVNNKTIKVLNRA